MNENINSIGMAKPPKSHQKLIADLLFFLNDELLDNYFPLPEANINDSDQFSNVPDILVVDDDEMNVFAIEIEQKTNIKTAIRRMQSYLAANDISEGFAIQYKPQGFINYSIEKWFRVTPNEIEENETYSNTLEIDFEDFEH